MKALIMGEEYCPGLEKALLARGISLLSCPKNPRVDERLSSHADLSVFYLGKGRFLLAAYLENTDFSRVLTEMGAELFYSKSRQGREYPDDAGLCALPLGGSVFHNKKHTDPLISERLPRLINVAQGYAKCAVCTVSGSAAITADRGMARALKAEGIKVLEISAGHIALSGFDEGFIGGAAFFLSPTELAFSGSLDVHPDKGRIEAFLSEQGVCPVYLTEHKVFDIGSAFPIF